MSSICVLCLDVLFEISEDIHFGLNSPIDNNIVVILYYLMVTSDELCILYDCCCYRVQKCTQFPAIYDTKPRASHSSNVYINSILFQEATVWRHAVSCFLLLSGTRLRLSFENYWCVYCQRWKWVELTHFLSLQFVSKWMLFISQIDSLLHMWLIKCIRFQTRQRLKKWVNSTQIFL